jgi:hypothetical protein
MTTSTIEQVVAAVQDIALTITSVRTAPDSMPDKIEIGPVVLTYPESGELMGNSAQFSTELHRITCEVLVPGASWQQVYKVGLSIVIPLCRAIVKAPTLAGIVQTFGSVTYEFRPDPIAWLVHINDVKIQDTW